VGRGGYIYTYITCTAAAGERESERERECVHVRREKRLRYRQVGQVGDCLNSFNGMFNFSFVLYVLYFICLL
jgi:hypothetical protein